MLNPRGEPLVPDDLHSVFNKAVREAADESFHEMTGKKGDVILMHPLMLHSASKNGKRAIRESLSTPSPLFLSHFIPHPSLPLISSRRT